MQQFNFTVQRELGERPGRYRRVRRLGRREAILGTKYQPARSGPGRGGSAPALRCDASRRDRHHLARKLGQLLLLLDADDARKTVQQRTSISSATGRGRTASTTSAATAATMARFRKIPRTARADWASSNSDVRHRVNLAATYQLPFGPGRRYASGARSARERDRYWEIGGIAVLQSGLPFTVTVAGFALEHRSAAAAPIPSPGVDPNPANRNINLWFNPAAFTTPPAFTWGTLGRNSLNAPPLYNFDFSISKKFRFGEVARNCNSGRSSSTGSTIRSSGCRTRQWAWAAREQLRARKGRTGRSSLRFGSPFEASRLAGSG